jgi:hypothetical protein
VKAIERMWDPDSSATPRYDLEVESLTLVRIDGEYGMLFQVKVLGPAPPWQKGHASIRFWLDELRPETEEERALLAAYRLGCPP